MLSAVGHTDHALIRSQPGRKTLIGAELLPTHAPAELEARLDALEARTPPEPPIDLTLALPADAPPLSCLVLRCAADGSSSGFARQPSFDGTTLDAARDARWAMRVIDPTT